MIFAMTLLSVWTMASCGEEDNEIEEFPNWQAANDAYFNRLSDSVKALLAADPSRTDWKRIKSWSKSDGTEGQNSDYIIVHVLAEENPGATESPLYTDTASVSYAGYLIPSVSYPSGYKFGYTYEGEYNKETCVSVSYAVGSSSGTDPIDGFSTALQHMHRGDRWMVYIPYKLGYDNVEYGGIPAYSTLIYDLILTDFWSPEYPVN